MDRGTTQDSDTSTPGKLISLLAQSREVIAQALDQYDSRELAVAITGGKDSTLALWIVINTCREKNCAVPTCMFIDEGDMFEEIDTFVAYLESKWRLDIVRMKNEDVADKVDNLYEEVLVPDLNEENQREIAAIGYTQAAFPFEPESYVGNHLMKTVPMKQFLRQRRIKGLVTAIRRDEQDARVSDCYFSPRQDPDHTRIHPILHFTERDVWDVIHHWGIPFCKLYYQGYRSLGAKTTTHKVSDIPAWEQDLENTSERSGRADGKEQVMEKLRELGYM